MATADKVFTSRIWVVPDTFIHSDIYLDIVSELNISKPNFIYINDEKSIKIDHIRQLQGELISPPVDPLTTRVILIHPLEKLLHVAQQSLLKLLEEPPARTAIVLAGNSLNGLAPTILSRCEVVWRTPRHPETSTEELTFWTQAETATWQDLTKLLSQAPDKKEEAIAWVRAQLTQRPASVTPRSVHLTAALNEAYEALQSNVTPKLVWGRVVAQVATP